LYSSLDTLDQSEENRQADDQCNSNPKIEPLNRLPAI
jgi:hypothetical protein